MNSRMRRIQTTSSKTGKALNKFLSVNLSSAESALINFLPSCGVELAKK
jgi:hypothetical protein